MSSTSRVKLFLVALLLFGLFSSATFANAQTLTVTLSPTSYSTNQYGPAQTITATLGGIGEPPYSFAWYVDGVYITTTTSNSYTPPTNTQGIFHYNCIVTYYITYYDYYGEPYQIEYTASSNTVTWTIGDFLYYYFEGLFDEDTGALVVDPAVNVTAYYDDGTSPVTFEVDSSYNFSTATAPQYFFIDLPGIYDREYWLSPSEKVNVLNGPFYLYTCEAGLADVVVTFRDLANTLTSADLCIIQRSINGIYQVVEKRLIDTTKTAVVSVKPNTVYNVIIGNGVSYTFGNVNMYMTPITLTVNGLEFPQSLLLQYKYIQMWAARPNQTVITVNYQDTKAETVYITYSLADANGVVAYSTTKNGVNSFSDTINGLATGVNYYITATILHTTFGSLDWSQILPYSPEANTGFNMDFLGSWPVNSNWLLFAALALCVFAIFSTMNAYIGAFLGCAVVTVLAWQGFLQINVGALVAAWGFAVVLGVTFAKRRLFT